MATVFKIQRSKPYVGEYTDEFGVRRRIYTGLRRRRDAVRALQNIEQRAKYKRLVRDDTVRDFDTHLGCPVDHHLQFYETFLNDKGDSPGYIVQTLRHLRRILDGMRIKYLDAVVIADSRERSADERFRHWLRDTSPTDRHRRNSILVFQRFLKVLADHHRLPPTCPILTMRPPKITTSQTRDRRALTEDEIESLMQAVSVSHHRFKIAPYDRVMLYRTALQTGLRRSEIAALKPCHFIFDYEAGPVLRCDPEWSKNRSLAYIPLVEPYLSDIREYLQNKPAQKRAWSVPYNTARMLRSDLRLAGIPYVDQHGRVADFHALRHTFITRLVLAGVDLAKVQLLARHSTIRLTIETYSHLSIPDLAGALSLAARKDCIPSS